MLTWDEIVKYSKGIEMYGCCNAGCKGELKAYFRPEIHPRIRRYCDYHTTVLSGSFILLEVQEEFTLKIIENSS